MLMKIYIRLVQSKCATFGKWPDWSYGHGQLGEIFSFKLIYNTWHKSEFQARYNGFCKGGPLIIAIQNRPACGISRT